jgi:hypothetical protein
MRAGLGLTLRWYVVAALLSLPLIAVRMPSHGDPCRTPITEPAWAAFVFRDVLWISMAVFLPISAAITAVIIWRSGLSARRSAAIGAGVGLILVLANVANSMATSTCYIEIHIGPAGG